MANKRINDLTTEASVTDSMYVEVDEPGFAESKKATIEEITEIERTARQAQDDVIEASVGLNADGSFTPPAASNYLKAADYLAAGYNENILNGLRLLDNQVYANALDIGSTLITVERVLTVAEINTLFTVPVVLVNTVGWAAGWLPDVIDCVAKITYSAPVWTTAETLDIGYTGGADILTFTNGLVVSGANALQKATPIDNAAMTVANIEARFPTTNPTAPPGASEITIYLSYRIIETI